MKEYLGGINKRGLNVNKKDAKIIGENIKKLMDENNSELSPKKLVEYSRPHNSPLHKYFQWDNRKAAEKWRLQQARQLIGWIQIELIQGKPIRAFVNVSNDDMEKSYVTIQRALSDDDLRKQLLNTALREVEFWKDQYLSLKELSPVFKAISIVKNKVKKVLV